MFGLPIRQPLAGILHLRLFCFTSALDDSLHVLQSSPVDPNSPPYGLMVEAAGFAPASRELVERFNDYELKYILSGLISQVEFVNPPLEFGKVLRRRRLKQLESVGTDNRQDDFLRQLTREFVDGHRVEGAL